MKTIKNLKRIHIVENKIEIRMRDLAEKWKHSNREVSDACRDAAEEIRVLRETLIALRSGLSYSNGPDRPQYFLGWGKGKDE
jgi:hypothetical protein